MLALTEANEGDYIQPQIFDRCTDLDVFILVAASQSCLATDRGDPITNSHGFFEYEPKIRFHG
jgi:hypothetical protein